MLHWDSECYSIGLDLSNRISSGLVKVWDGPSFGVNGDYHGDHPNNPWRGQVHMWSGSSTSTFIHEGAHSVLGAADGPASQYGTAAYWADYCWTTLV